MTSQTPPEKATFTATVRLQFHYAPGPDAEPYPDIEVAATRKVVFALPPHKGDVFVPGQLTEGFLDTRQTPFISSIEHALDLPDGNAWAVVVVQCITREVPSDELLEQLRTEGWGVSDFRKMVQKDRDDRTS